MRKILITCILTLVTLLPACSIYTIDIQQGNTLEAEDIAKLKLGMTPQQVEFVMGTALLKDPFHQNRWDYIYTMEKEDEPAVRRLLTVYFENGALARIDDSELKEQSLRKVQ